MSGVSPLAVGILRGIAEAAVLAALSVVIVAVGDVEAGTLGIYGPLLVAVIRSVEGAIDNKLDPGVKRLSGAPVTLP